MAPFTFIADYRGGTYIFQQRADSLRQACELWKADVLTGRYIQALDPEAFTRAFEADIDQLPPVAIEGVTGVWLFLLRLGRHRMEIHVVQPVGQQGA